MNDSIFSKDKIQRNNKIDIMSCKNKKMEQNRTWKQIRTTTENKTLQNNKIKHKQARQATMQQTAETTIMMKTTMRTMMIVTKRRNTKSTKKTQLNATIAEQNQSQLVSIDTMSATPTQNVPTHYVNDAKIMMDTV